MKPLVHDSTSTRQTAAIAQRLAPLLRAGDVVGLEGPLGAGKTTFIRALAEALGVDRAAVTSPTFTLCHMYDARGLRIAHVDAYRMSGPDDLATIGWEEMLDDPKPLVLIEWPSKILDALPVERTLWIEIDHTGPHSRRLTLTAPPAIEQRLDDLRSIRQRD